MSLFELQNITFFSKTSQIISETSLSIEQGTVTSFMGKSGCGKSTLLKITDGLIIPTTGRVLYKGIDIQSMSTKQNLQFRKECSFVFQDSALWANQSIQQILELSLNIHYPNLTNKEKSNRIQAICNTLDFGKSLSFRPADLSTGEQKKISIARALINNPSVLFLDECTESLDEKATSLVIFILKQFLQDGNTIIYISHRNRFIQLFPGFFYYMEDGKIISSENTKDIKNEI